VQFQLAQAATELEAARLMVYNAARLEDAHEPYTKEAAKMHMERQVRRAMGYEGDILYAEHHESHAASAFFPSPFTEAAILTIDGVGEWATGRSGWVATQTSNCSRNWPGRCTWPHTEKSLVPVLLGFERQRPLYHAAPRFQDLRHGGQVSTLLIVVGIPNRPAAAGKGGLIRGCRACPRSSSSAPSLRRKCRRRPRGAARS